METANSDTSSSYVSRSGSRGDLPPPKPALVLQHSPHEEEIEVRGALSYQEAEEGRPPSAPREPEEQHAAFSHGPRRRRVEEVNREWSQKVEQEVQEERGLVAQLQAMERALNEKTKEQEALKASSEKEIHKLRAALQEEKAAREKAEADLGELLGEVQQGESGDTSRRSSGVLGDTFYTKLREREDRARAKVRREFIRKSQEELHEERARREAAEKLSEEADKRIQRAERLSKDAVERKRVAEQKMEEALGELQERSAQCESLLRELDTLRKLMARSESHIQRERETISAATEAAEARAVALEEELQRQREKVSKLLGALGVKEGELSEELYTTAHLQRLLEEQLKRQHTFTLSEVREREAIMKAEIMEATRLLEELQARYLSLQQREETLQQQLQRAAERLARQSEEAEQDLRKSHDRNTELQLTLRSLELQLQNVTHAHELAQQEAAARRESDRQEKESLVRRYEGELHTLQEELDRLRIQHDRDRETLLRRALEVSEERTQLLGERSSLSVSRRPTTHLEPTGGHLVDSLFQRSSVQQTVKSVPQERERASLPFTPSPHRSRTEVVAEIDWDSSDRDFKVNIISEKQPTTGASQSTPHRRLPPRTMHTPTLMEESSIVAQQHPKHDNSGTNHTQNSADSFLLPEGILGYSPLPRNSVQRSPSLQDGTTHSIQPAPTTASPLRYRPGLPSNSNNISYSEIDDIRGEVAARLQEVKQQRSRSAVEEEGARPRRRRSSASPDPFGRPSR